MIKNELEDESRVALVVGANGIVGSNMLEHLRKKTKWKLYGLARRPITQTSNVIGVVTDLLDESSSSNAIKSIGPVDYLYFSALDVRGTQEDQIIPNLTMLQNAVTPLLDPLKNLKHICLVHGTKWYGSHLGPYRTPAREGDSRHQGPNFYYDQYDWLTSAQKNRDWSFSTIRPHFINGFNVGNPNNMMAAIGAYAAVQRAQGKPLDFPGTLAAYESLTMVSDVSIVNASMLWASISPHCANHDFNIHNGDYFRWCNVWPMLADALGMSCGKVVTKKLSDYMLEKGSIWDQIVLENGLIPNKIDRIVSWKWADFFFRGEWDDMSSMLKARSFGFEQFIDTQEDILAGLARYRSEKILPTI
jgi:nucleoside-diphosphate-sugar epimerase